MNSSHLYNAFSKKFDVVGIISTKHYLEEAKKMKKDLPNEDYQTMVVLGLAYPYRPMKQSKTHLTSSFYTYGSDYHTVLKLRITEVMEELKYPYKLGVDNHPHDERLAAVLAGIGFYGKNQLIINHEYGSYLFLGVVFIDCTIEEAFILEIDDDCGSCRKCIDACPTHALDENFYDVNQCISYFNQSKHVLNNQEIQANYALFGCDICQMVCPKNINKGKKVHPEFQLSGKEMVSIMDLFIDSEKEFGNKYSNMSYLWKGKTILMRNALTLLLRQKNISYNSLIKDSIEKNVASWYKETAVEILKRLEVIKKAQE